MGALGDRYRGRAQLCLVLGFLLTAGAGLLSNGTYHEDDLSHFLCARWVGHDFRYLLDVWARPGFTLLYALPATLGSPEVAWHLCRPLSALLHAGAAWFAYRIAVHYGLRHAWLAVPLMYIEPLPVVLSLTTLTETPLAFYLAAATWLLLKRRPLLSALVISLAPLTRLDAVVFLLLWIPALRQRSASLWAYPALLAGLIVQNALGAVFLKELPILVYAQANGATHYGMGTPLTFIVLTLVCAGPVGCAFVLMGLRRFMARPLGWLPVVGCALFILVHTVIYSFAAFSSGGYARFLVPLGPWLAVLAAAGVGVCLNDVERQRDRNWRTLAVILVIFWLMAAAEMALRPPVVRAEWQTAVRWVQLGVWVWSVFLIWAAVRLNSVSLQSRRSPARIFVIATIWLLIVVQIGWAIRPLRLREEQRIAAEAVTWVESNQPPDRPWLAVNRWVHYWSDRWMPQGEPDFDDLLRRASPGTLLFWDARFCSELARPLALEAMRSNPAWRELYACRPAAGGAVPFMVVFERTTFRPAAMNPSLSRPSQP